MAKLQVLQEFCRGSGVSVDAGSQPAIFSGGGISPQLS